MDTRPRPPPPPPAPRLTEEEEADTSTPLLPAPPRLLIAAAAAAVAADGRKEETLCRPAKGAARPPPRPPPPPPANIPARGGLRDSRELRALLNLSFAPRLRLGPPPPTLTLALALPVESPERPRERGRKAVAGVVVVAVAVDTAGLGAVNGRGTAGLGAVDLATGLKKVSRERACHVSGGEIVGDCFRGSEWHVGGGGPDCCQHPRDKHKHLPGKCRGEKGSRVGPRAVEIFFLKVL